MGANAVTTVPVYTAGEVLTAADMNITNSGIPVFATTVTRDAAFGGSGEKTLAEGQFAYIEATNTTQYYDGATWQPVGASGLVLISSTTIGTTVSSVTVSNAFSATYDNYRIVVSGGSSSAVCTLRLTLGATATGYHAGIWDVSYAGLTGATGQNNTAFWLFGTASNTLVATGDILQPFLSDQTSFSSMTSTPSTGEFMRIAAGFLNDTTSYTAFTITPSTGTLTGGTIRVYGYANS